MQSKYVEAIGILEELLRIKKINFGINSKDVRNKRFSSTFFDHSSRDLASNYAKFAIF
jgi:hypothetical protein